MAVAVASPEWASTHEACKLLRLSRTTLQKLKTAGHFTPGVHYYRRGMGATAPVAWNVDACRAVLLQLTAAEPSALETYELPRAGGA